jgi:hypothetical protein
MPSVGLPAATDPSACVQGDFVAIDAAELTAAAKLELDALTEGGAKLVGCIMTHPFHTLAIPAFHAAYPATESRKYYGCKWQQQGLRFASPCPPPLSAQPATSVMDAVCGACGRPGPTVSMPARASVSSLPPLSHPPAYRPTYLHPTSTCLPACLHACYAHSLRAGPRHCRAILKDSAGAPIVWAGGDLNEPCVRRAFEPDIEMRIPAGAEFVDPQVSQSGRQAGSPPATQTRQAGRNEGRNKGNALLVPVPPPPALVPLLAAVGHVLCTAHCTFTYRHSDWMLPAGPGVGGPSCVGHAHTYDIV